MRRKKRLDKRPMAEIREWIESRVIMCPMGGCWWWSAGIGRKGYATHKIAGQNVRMHRLSWRAFRGRIPAGKMICHSCDIRCCVNPAHLFVGTAKDNAQDMVRKGRSLLRAIVDGKCGRGHVIAEVGAGGPNQRRCRQCSRDDARAWYWRQKSALGTDSAEPEA